MLPYGILRKSMSSKMKLSISNLLSLTSRPGHPEFQIRNLKILTQISMYKCIVCFSIDFPISLTLPEFSPMVDFGENTLSVHISFSSRQHESVIITKRYLLFTGPYQIIRYLLLSESDIIRKNLTDTFYSVKLSITENDHGLGVVFAAYIKFDENNSLIFQMFSQENYLDYYQTFSGMRFIFLCQYDFSRPLASCESHSQISRAKKP